jgi:hypothetical protein
MPISGRSKKEISYLIKETNEKLDNSRWEYLSDLETIEDFKSLYHQDQVEFYKLILHSPHRYTIPIAISAIFYDYESKKLMNKHRFLITSYLKQSEETDDFSRCLCLCDLIYEATNLIEDIILGTENGSEIRIRVDSAKYFILCFRKLLKLYEAEVNVLNICNGKIYY